MPRSANDSLPLAGIKVLDMSQGVAGPHAGMLFAQHGADVVKVEPLEGDWGRTLGKRYGDLSAHAIAFNRGKRSLAVDLKNSDGCRVVQQLASKADIVIESFRPGVMSRFGLGYDDIKAQRPDVIYVSITGFGQQGPYSKLPVTDSIIQAFSGWMTLHRDGAGTPMRSGIIAIDVMTGLYAYQAAASALIRRLRFGGGAYIDCSMLQSAAAFQAAKILEFYLEDGKPEVSYVPVGVMPTADGFITISAMRDAHYAALCDVLERPDLAIDERYDSRDKRRANKAELMPTLMREFEKHPTAEWAQKLTAVGVMNARINTYGDFMGDEHVKAIGTLAYTDHGALGSAPAAMIPGVTLPGTAALHCPAVGEHTTNILSEAGFAAAEIADMQKRNAVR